MLLLFIFKNALQCLLSRVDILNQRRPLMTLYNAQRSKNKTRNKTSMKVTKRYRVFVYKKETLSPFKEQV